MVEITKKYKIGTRRFGLINWVGAWTLYQKEVLRFLNVWAQTLFSPLISSLLFLLVLSLAIGAERGDILGVSFITFLVSLLLWVWFDKSTAKFQFVDQIFWVPSLNLNLTMGIDGISLFLVILTTLLIPLCILASWVGIKTNVKEYLIAFLVMESFLIGVFCVLDLLLFYVLFESVLIPMFLIIGIWGSRERKMRAAFLFFLYTLFGSVSMLISILYI